MIRLGLDSICYLCHKLNDPQDKLRFIHIAGTNGKGSTAAFTASMLKEAHLRVGVYSSPAVIRREEVIRVGGRCISASDYDEGMAHIDEVCKDIESEGKLSPTEFERETALALMYFVKKECDVVVLECGMGGETDATNVVNNTLAAVFTSISWDHMDYLGDSLHKIAWTKSGIIKKGSCVFTSNTDEDVVSAIRERALENGATVSLNGELVNIIKPNKALKKYTSMNGVHQLENASLAVSVVRQVLPKILEKLGRSALSEDNFKRIIENGLHNAYIPGRFERIAEKPLIIIDGGHNPGAAEVLHENIMSTIKNKKLFIVVGMLRNKDHDKVLKTVIPEASQVFTISTFGERGYSALELANDALPYNKNVTAVGGVEEALDMALMMADKKDAILIFGSFTFLKNVKDHIKERLK